MRCLFLKLLFLLLLINSIVKAQQTGDDLDRYVEGLRRSSASGGSETAFMSAGADFLYGQDYFEAKNYSSAVWYFQDVLKKESDNAFAHYQLAISLLRQNDQYKTKQAEQYLQEAFRLNPSLKSRYSKDMPDAKSVAVKSTVQTGAASTILPSGLHAYIEELKYSRATGGKETAMFSEGQEVMYAYDYYEKGEYRSAESRFRQALSIAPDNPYILYLLAVSEAAQGKNDEAQVHYNKAINGDAGLNKTYVEDVAEATARHKKYEQSRKIKTSPGAKPVYGGALMMGNYTCHQTVYNGTGSSSAFSFQYKGYFALRADGTYRWLDNGATGRYRYDPKTGTVTFLSGHLVTAQSARYQKGTTTAQITVNFDENYRWECGCKKSK